MKEALTAVTGLTGKKFIAIIDEWDAPVRDTDSTEKIRKNYLEFLRSLFKSEITKKVFAAAYMTGILPMIKEASHSLREREAMFEFSDENSNLDGTQSAISEFCEYSILEPDGFAPYTGFTEADVKEVCLKYDRSFEMMREWYNGYTLYTDTGEPISVYNPNSVMKAADRGLFKSYWGQTSAVYGALSYINMDFDGLGDAVERLTAGLSVSFDTQAFQNDLVTFDTADDVLTLLTHFGYITYDQEKREGLIPNYEIIEEFGRMIHKVSHKETIKRLKESEQLLADIISGNADAVAENIRLVHMKESTPLWYNDEQALRAVIKLAFFTYRDHYIKLEELPSGTGYADMAYIPKKYDPVPPLIIELKADGTPEGAIEQIRLRNYASSIEGLGDDPLLIAVTYEKGDKTKPHHCRIERWDN
ncbi:MAG: AAA family ATPase [Lachnospiraceae bacterium]|nr:AAA family ATPase [Lachnospiraceae bacterium]